MCCLTQKFLRDIIFGFIINKMFKLYKIQQNSEGVWKMKLDRIWDELLTDWGDNVVDR